MVAKIPKNIFACEIQESKQERSLDKHHCSLVRDLNSAWTLLTCSAANYLSVWYAQWTTRAAELNEAEALHWCDWPPVWLLEVFSSDGATAQACKSLRPKSPALNGHLPLQSLRSCFVNQATSFGSLKTQNWAPVTHFSSSLKCKEFYSSAWYWSHQARLAPTYTCF